MRVRYIFALVIAALAVSAAVTFFVAQPLSAKDAEQPPSAQNADGELEEFRGKLAIYFAELAEVYPNVVDAGGPPELLESISEAQQMIPELTDEELGVLREAISQNPAWWDLPTIIRLSFGPEAQGLQATAQEAQGSTGSLLSHSCPAPALGFPFTGPQKHIQNEFAFKGVSLGKEVLALGLQAVMEGIPEPLNVLAIVPWAAAEGLVLSSRGVVLSFEGKNAVNDECEEDNHRQTVHDVVGPTVLDIDEKLDTTTEMKRVHLQVVELTKKREFLVGASEAGEPVVDVEFLAVQVSDDDPISFVDVTADTTVTVVKPGIHQVVIDLPKGVTGADIFEFRVKHSHASFTHSHASFTHSHASFDHFGVILFDRGHGDNLAMGQ